MLIQRSLPDSLSTELSFVSDLAKQHNMELFCDWSHCREVWQKAPNGKCPFNTCRKSICTGGEGSKISSSEIMEISKTSSDISAVKDTCANFASKWDGFVYKRRRLRRNTNTLLSEENTINCDKGINGSAVSIISTGNPLTMQKNALPSAPVFTVGGSSGQPVDSGNSSISGQHHLHKSITIPCSQIKGAQNSASFLESMQNDRLLVKVVTLPAETSVSNHLKSTSKHCFHVHTSSSSSKSNSGHNSAIMKAQVDCGECSSSDVIATAPLEEFTSAKELCISFLKRHGLLVGVKTTSAYAPPKILGVNDANISESCKICNLLENPLKMLICDLCEDAFHVSCCHPKVKKLPVDHWYCQPCFKKKPKALVEISPRKSANILSEHRYRRSHGRGGPILSMLRDNQPYTSEVRIGKDFQAEIPQWTGPISEYVFLMCLIFNSHYFEVWL